MRKIIKKLLNLYADAQAKAKKFVFPKKFTWRWKLEMLQYRYEPETTEAIRSLIKPGMNVVDIGAHIGYYTRLLAECVGPQGSVYAFEPEPYNFRLLQQNTHGLNSVHLYDTALIDSGSEVEFYQTSNKTGCHSVVPNKDAVKMTVNADTFDALADKYNMKNIDLIKMDIEGGEPRALQGMLKTIQNSASLILITEANPEGLQKAGTSFEAFISLLTSLGFTCYYLLPGATKEVGAPEHSVAQQYYKQRGYLNILCKKGLHT